VVSITNTGVIRSINAFSAAGAGLAYSEGISVGGGSITNSGTIEGLVAAGNGNALGRGITLAGNDITSGALAGTREGLYANAVVTNQAGGLIRGQNDSAIFATGAASGYSVTIHNQAGATIRGGGTTSAAIVTGKDNTTINNAGTIDGSSSGKAIEMGSGNNTLNVTGGSASIVGSINGGIGGSNQLTLSPGAGNSFNYAGSISNFNRVEVLSGNVRFSGVSSYTGATRLSGGTLTLDGANRLSASSALELNGGTLKISNASGTVGQVFGSLVLSDSSTIDLGSSVLVFNSLGTIASGKTLSVLNASANGYAFQLLGDYSGDMAFASLLGATTINGMAARYHFDGAYTDVTAVPEPDTLAMLLAGVGLIGTVTRRRRQNRV
jgi:autotransporter-associated beta strand protein